MRPRTIVIGGGYAGIAAALTLADHGDEVTLLEARRHWGGRATSWPDPQMGDVVDNGQHVWLGCYDATRALLSRLGTLDRVAFAPGLDLAYRDLGGRAHALKAQAMLGRAGLALALARFGAVPPLDRLGLARAIAEAPAPHPTLTASEWLDGLAQPPSARRAFWGPLAEAAINLPLTAASATLLFAVVARAFRGTANAAAVGIPRTGLAELVAPIADLLAARGGRARLGAPVRAVVRAAVVETGFEVRLESGEALTAERVVIAAPAADARGLLAALPATAARLAEAAAVPPSPIVSVTLWFPARVLDHPVVGLLAPAQGGGPGFHWAFDRGSLVPPPRDAPKRAWPLVLVASCARELVTLPTAAIVERARAALEAYAITRLEPVAARVIKEPRATPAFSPQAALARPGVDTGLLGLAFAGDWTATGLPATIEGAVTSGLAAARHVLGSAGAGSAILRHPTSTPSEGPA